MKTFGVAADISFTGHSLGGGLASLMSVWFDRPSIVFAPAPFLGAIAGQAALRAQAWHVQFDTAAMNWADSEGLNDASIGGIAADNIDGDAGNDLLIGRAGADDLKGGASKICIAFAQSIETLVFDWNQIAGDYTISAEGISRETLNSLNNAVVRVDMDMIVSHLTNHDSLRAAKICSAGLFEYLPYASQSTVWADNAEDGDIIISSFSSVQRMNAPCVTQPESRLVLGVISSSVASFRHKAALKR